MPLATQSREMPYQSQRSPKSNSSSTVRASLRPGYCARHDFGTYVPNRAGNLKLVMESMGHTDVPTALKYQHPELVLEIVREVINSRQTPRHTRQTAN